MVDDIRKLPTDSFAPNPYEQQLVQSLFARSVDPNAPLYHGDLKKYGALGVAFVMYSMPMFDQFLISTLPMCSNSHILVVVKAIAFVMTAYIIQHSHLVRA